MPEGSTNSEGEGASLSKLDTGNPLGVTSENLEVHYPQSEEELYNEILYREAHSLLAKYLPEALPQEPTEVLREPSSHISAGSYLGKFKGKHYIQTTPQVASSDQIEAISQDYADDIEKWATLFQESEESGSAENVNLDDLMDQIFNKVTSSPTPKLQSNDWDEPKRLLDGGHAEFSKDTWSNINIMVHELIHQRQAELNPAAFPEPSSPELVNFNPEGGNKGELVRMLLQATRSYDGQRVEDNLFAPVTEGMAVVGSYYVMGRLAADLMKLSQKDVVKKINQARNSTIRAQVGEAPRELNVENKDYIEGSGMIRKIYKQLGENTPQALVSVDLNACRQISRSSPQGRQIMGNPLSLPGLKAA